MYCTACHGEANKLHRSINQSFISHNNWHGIKTQRIQSVQMAGTTRQKLRL